LNQSEPGLRPVFGDSRGASVFSTAIDALRAPFVRAGHRNAAQERFVL